MKEQTYKKLLEEWENFRKSGFYESLNLKIDKARLDILEQLGNKNLEDEMHLRWLQGINEGIKRMQRFPSKYANELEAELEKIKTEQSP